MATSSHQLRTLAHKLLNEAECAELKTSIQTFKKDKSVLLLCASLYKILSTPEKMHILLAVYPMIPQDLQRDFDSLCSLQFDYYATTLRPKITEKYDKKTKGRHKTIKESTKSSALFSIEQIRRFHTPRDSGPDGDAKSSSKDEIAASSSKGTRKNKELRHRRSPDQTRRHARGGQQQRKRSKTAHAVLGPAKVQSPRIIPRITKDPDPPRVPPPRVPPLELDNSNVSSNTSANSSQRSSQHTPKNIPIRKVKLERRDGGSLGFAIRGGSDLKSGIYVSEVDAGGQADRRGLQVGERILKVNDCTFKNVSHSEAVSALLASRKVTIYVANVGLMPGPPTPRSTGTPREVNTNHAENSKKMSARSQEESPRDTIKKLTVFADDDNYMGCSIRGGVDCGMDVMVAHVDPGSPAYKAGLKKGQCIIKVNDTPVDTLTHMQVINLITATKVVIFEVKPGSKDKLQSFRKQKNTVAASSHISNHESVHLSTPRATSDEQMSMEDFEKELMSTPPVSTSTPLPPEDHPLLLENRPAEFNSKHHIDDASIMHLLQTGQVSPTHDVGNHGNLDDPCDMEDQDETLLQNKFDSNFKESKFDKGTIKLNMVEKDQKDILKTAKIIDISIAPTSKKDRRRSHVKDIFADNFKTQGTVKTSRSESCRSPPRRPKTPQRAHTLNVLSTPKNKHKQIIEVTPPRNQLHDATPTAKMQIEQELTGKRLLLSPNVPVAPNSPVSNFFRKVLHTDNNSRDKNLRKIGSLESFITHRGFEQSNMQMSGMSKWRSAYDFVTESDTDDED